MKKIFFSIGLASLAILSGCTKEDSPVQPSKGQAITLTAVVSQDEADSKVNVGDDATQATITWKSGDVLAVFGNGTGTQYRLGTLTTAQDGVKSASFTGTVSADALNKYFVLYPNSAGYTTSTATTSVPLDLTGQNGTNRANYIFMKSNEATSATPGNNLTFGTTHIASMLKFSVKLTSAASNVKLKAISVNGTNIYDKMNLNLTNGVLTPAAGAQNVVSVTYATPLTLNNTTATDCFLMVFPATGSVTVKATLDINGVEVIRVLRQGNVNFAAGKRHPITFDVVPSIAVGDAYVLNGAPVGVVFWLDPGNIGHGKIVSLNAGVGLTIVDALAWQVGNLLGTLGSNMPTKDDLQYLWCAYNGANPVTWNGTASPCPPANSVAQAAFNANLTTPLGTVSYWGSLDVLNRWIVSFSDGGTTSILPGILTHSVRSIATF